MIGLTTALRPIVEQISQLTRQIAGATKAHPDGAIFLALFRDPKSVITAAGLLAEIGDNRARYPPTTRSPPTPAKPQSQSSPASATTRPSAGHATSACAST